MMKKKRLKKELGLFGVFSISTGAMFSSGFFLLPGLAAQYTGPSVFLAYFLSGLLIVPAMFSIAEITTAIPKAGGAYYIIDRTFGPMLGTIGGLGTYFALILKSAFALIGIGAYTSLIFDIPIKPVAIVLTIIFAIVNILGSKKSSSMQNILVLLLLFVLSLIIIDGIFQIFTSDTILMKKNNLSPFLEQGVGGLFATIGFVFVSYAGLTKIASVAEEIKNPERNIPLGMILSLSVTTLIYVLGTFLMVIFIDKGDFANDLTPVATLTNFTLRWLPAKVTLIMVVFAALAAFASTGNAGIMSSSRYPLAMSRDKILPSVFGKLDKKFHVPVFSILITSTIIIFIIIFVSEEGIAKMASTFQLLIFFFINLAVVVLRKSKIESYDPGFKSPFYPWAQILGMFFSFILIIYMGWTPTFFSFLLIFMSLVWYRYYVRKRVKREGAIYHWFALLGQHKYDKIENEFLHIIKEKGLREEDKFDRLITDANISFTNKKGLFKLKSESFNVLLDKVADDIVQSHDITKKELILEFEKASTFDPDFIIPQISISFAACNKIKNPSASIVLSEKGIKKKITKHGISSTDRIHVFFFIVAPKDNNKLLLRILSRLMDITDRENFLQNILSLQTAREVKEYLLHNDRYVSLKLDEKNELHQQFINHKIKNIDLPKGILIALIDRDDQTVTPDGNTIIQNNDVLTILGKPEKLKQFRNQFKI